MLFFAAKTFPALEEHLGAHFVFSAHASICLFASLISFAYMPDTNGMSCEEIEDMYRSGKIKK